MRPRTRAFGQLLFVIVMLLLDAGFVAFTWRTTDVTCQRVASDSANCSEVERIGDRQVWSAAVNNATLTRRANPQDDSQGAVLLETKNGDDQPFTSGWISEADENTIADRIHQFIYTDQKVTALKFELGSYESPADWLLPGVFGAALVVVGIYSLIRLVAS